MDKARDSRERISFFEQVYRIVQAIPLGQVTSYGAIALMLEHPRAARTVGWALHSLSPGSGVPWHRVINSKGRISTSCQEHSASLQRELLEAEGVEFDEHDTVDWNRFGWSGFSGPELQRILKQSS